MSWSVKSQGHSNPENPEGRGRFFESNHFKCVISLFLLPSFPFSLLWQRQQTFVSWEALDLALPLVDPEKKDTRKSAFATSQLRFSKGICLEALMLLWNAKTRIHPWLFRLPRLWLPFPLPNPDKQAGGSHFSPAASCAARLSLLIKITHLSAGEEPAARPRPGTALGTVPSCLPWS